MSHTHANNFDFIRFAAAVIVCWGHDYLLTGSQDPLSALIPFESLGGLGASIFFIISGYFITLSFERHNGVFPFLRNRALRIIPALAVAVLLCVFVLGPCVTTLSLHAYFSHPESWRYLRITLIFPLYYDLPGVFQSHLQHAVNGSLETLPLQVRLYLIIAFLGFLGILQPRVMMALFLGCMAIMVYEALGGTRLFSFIHYTYLFFGGSMIYMFRQIVPRHIGFLTGCFLLMILSTKFSSPWAVIVFDLSLIYSVIYIGFLRFPLLPRFTRFGDFSYGIYLYAFPMQQLALFLMHGDKTSFKMLMLLSFVATFICAMASWHLIEKPALRYKS